MTATRHARGRLLVLSAPSGAGKTTLVKALLEREPALRFSISYTTRPKRAAEIDGKDYRFVTDGAFRRLVEQGAFLEHARVFDYWYGTRRDDVEALREAGYSVLLEIDWQGARQVRARVPDAVSVFILPPSLEELKRRLRGRGTDPENVVERRLEDAVNDMTHWSEFDYTVFNDDIADAVDALLATLGGEERHRSGAPAVRARAEAIIRAAAGR